MKLDKFREVHKDIIAALSEVGKKHKLTFEAAGGRYGGTEDLFKISATENDASGKKRDVLRENYLKDGESYGLKLEWLGQTFAAGGYIYTVIGFRSGRTRFKVATLRNDGKQYSWTPQLVAEKFSPVKKAA